VLALGGAKNHLVALPDCEYEGAATDIVASFAGCAGQRCMAASVLILVGDTGDLLSKVSPDSPSAQARGGL
jgi:malonate-semialdehyde dehydrogenase (acetylating) / methylmalonate-semialdehyde dehydrogenase